MTMSRIGLGRRLGIASPTKSSLSAGEIVPPGLSITSSVMPCRMNMVDSVTTIGCMRSKATKKPLKAPDSMPMPTPAAITTERRGGGVLQRWRRAPH